MRVVGAGVFVFAGLLGLVGVASALGIFEHAPRWVVGPVYALLMSRWWLSRCGSSTQGDQIHSVGKEWRAGCVPTDGQIITDASYEDLKRESVGGAGEQRSASGEARRH